MGTCRESIRSFQNINGNTTVNTTLETLGTTQSRKLDNPEDLTSISPSARILGIRAYLF
jgi:hypothetical protein